MNWYQTGSARVYCGVHESVVGTKRTSGDVCFSNRPFGVKRFQTIHHHSVDVAHGLVLLFGSGASKAASVGGLFHFKLMSLVGTFETCQTSQ